MSDRETEARTIAGKAMGVAPESFVSPFTVLASPAWRGIESEVHCASAGDRAVIVKHYLPDTAFYVDPTRAIEAARHAAATGAGPKVLGDDAAKGLVVFEALGEGWRCGGLQDVVTPEVRRAVIAAKKAFQEGPKLGSNASIFAEIQDLAALIARKGVRRHRHLDAFLSVIGQAAGKIEAAGYDRKPCHRDGNSANLMIGPDNRVLLVDFDLSANADPYEELGCWLIEFFDCEPEARAGFEEWEGRFDEGLFQRAMLYGMADDLRWGMIASILAATSPRRSLEFAKYASWRFMRLENMALGAQAADRLRRAV